jgi:hypothetical protein
MLKLADMKINRSSLEGSVSKQILDDSYTGSLLHEVCGKGVPERVEGGIFGDSSR